jgi:23S rRNA pseudouridine1911/1915/1917 synthase
VSGAPGGEPSGSQADEPPGQPLEEPGAEEAVDVVVVPPALAGERLDRAVALLLDVPRARARTLVEAGEVLVDGRPAGRSHRLGGGETVLLPEVAAPTERRPAAEPMELVVRHEDADVVVVAKPVGLVVHPAGGHPTGTLVNGLLARYPELADVGDPARPGIVHRLDRDTSGLLLVARTPLAHERLVAALGRREIERRYLALVRGRPANARGVIDAPIGRSPRQRDRMAVTAGGRPARTSYEVLAERAGWALLACTLETGRTHQIRVHLQAVGHPVAGDPVYGVTPGPAGLRRQFLHAHRLSFDHPRTGEPLTVDEPLPADLHAVWDGLEGAS